MPTLRNLLRRDSTFGRFDLDVELDGGFLVIDGRKVAVSALPGLPRRDRGQLVLRLDSAMTQSFGSFVKVFGWYDNEWGYTCRLADLTRLVGHDLAA